MSNKRSRLFAASTSIVGGGKDGKQYRNVGPLPTFGAEKEKLQTPSSKLQRNTRLQAPKTEAAVSVKDKRPGLIARCFAKVKGLFGWKSSAAAIPKFALQPVQGELSLDNVKVKCNDLSDTDFELVAKPVPTKKAAPSAPEEVKPASAAPVAETGTRIWNRVTTLLGAGQS
jgi:hypothetical protein